MSDDVSNGDPIPVEKLARIYLKMRDKKSEMTKEFDAQIDKLEAQMKAVKTGILGHMKAIGAESIRTESGTVYRTVRKVYSTTDWESMHKFILEHQAPDLLEKRIQQTNMTAFLEENPDLLPPGLNANMEYSVNVRRS